MITSEGPDWGEQNKTKYCKSCARKTSIKPVYVKNGSYIAELCFCEKCWQEILDKINWGGVAVRR